MKKVLSIILSALMLISVATASVIPAMAKTYGSPASTGVTRSIAVSVNGKGSNDITYKVDSSDKDKITFTYNGDGDLTGWEFGGLVEGVDYEIIAQDGNSITIKLDASVSDVKANAIVDEGTSTTKPGETTTAKKDNGGTSPNTGASLAGVAAAGAGVAMLLALKKRDAE